jgi:DNA-binding transcriptional LysR family regulator
MDLELRHLRHIVAIAEDGQISHAAARLGIAQPPLSQSLQRIERMLGYSVFEHVGRKLVPTPAGRVLIEEARPILEAAEAAQNLAKRRATGGLSRLRIGFATWVLLEPLAKVIKEFRQQHPGIELEIEEATSYRVVSALRDGQLDLGLVILNYVPPLEGLQVRFVERSRYMAAVPAKWPIARRKSIRASDLASLPFVVFPAGATARFAMTCRKLGIAPKQIQKAGFLFTALHLVKNEIGVSLVYETAKNLGVPGVTFVPVSDIPEDLHSDIGVAWRTDTQPPELLLLADIIEREVKRSSTLLDRRRTSRRNGR